MKILAIAATTLLFFVNVAAAQMNTSLYIEEIKYKRPGVVEIEFDDNTVSNTILSWTGKETLSVFDKNGVPVRAEIAERGDSWLLLYVPDITEEDIYTFAIKRVSYGVRSDIEYTGFFMTRPGWKISYNEPPRFRRRIQDEAQPENVFIRDMEYSSGGRLEVMFAGRLGKKINLEWNGNERATVKDELGTVYETRIEEYGKNKIEVRISGVVENMNYTIEIANVLCGEETLTFRAGFAARDDWKYRAPRHKPGDRRPPF